MAAQPQYLTIEELADRLQLNRRTLANWRCSSVQWGPPYKRFGKKILYPLAAVETWELAHQYPPSSRGYDQAA